MHAELKNLASESSVRWVFRNRPLESLHPFAKKAAIAAECADRQGKFWEYSDELFEKQVDLTSDRMFDDIARQLNINVAEFRECELSGTPDNLRAQIAQAEDLDINLTPTLFINGKRFNGMLPYSALAESIRKY
jgi:protein-disulfide isomerase